MATNFLPLAATGLQPMQEEYPPADRWLRRLCLAILTDALKGLEGFGGRGVSIARARYGHEAWDWVLSDASYFFSFSLVCTVLDLNVEAVRRQIGHRFAPGSVLRNDLARLPRHPPAGPHGRRVHPIAGNGVKLARSLAGRGPSTSLRYAQGERGGENHGTFAVRAEPFDRLRTGYAAAAATSKHGVDP